MRALAWIVAAACALQAPQAAAEDFCTQVLALDDTSSKRTTAFDLSAILPEYPAAAAGCRQSLNAGGGKSLHCMWRFDYRAPEATFAFDALTARVQTCASEPGAKDTDVNHPDFYDLRVFQVADGDIGVSLKDKGALRQTLVFLNISRR